jgi:hypothetical protein
VLPDAVIISHHKSLQIIRRASARAAGTFPKRNDKLIASALSTFFEDLRINYLFSPRRHAGLALALLTLMSLSHTACARHLLPAYAMGSTPRIVRREKEELAPPPPLSLRQRLTLPINLYPL